MFFLFMTCNYKREGLRDLKLKKTTNIEKDPAQYAHNAESVLSEKTSTGPKRGRGELSANTGTCAKRDYATQMYPNNYKKRDKSRRKNTSQSTLIHTQSLRTLS